MFIHNARLKIFKNKIAQVKNRIGKALLRFKADPLGHAKPLTNAYLGSYRFRVGDYRIIFDIEDENIVVLRVGHRRQIYRG